MTQQRFQHGFGRIGKELWPASLLELAEFLAERLHKSLKVSAADAEQKAADLVMCVSESVGGLLIYLPREEARLIEEVRQMIEDADAGRKSPAFVGLDKKHFCDQLRTARANNGYRWEVYVQRIAAAIYGYELERGTAPHEARPLVETTVLTLADYGNGKMFVVPSGHRVRAALAHMEIADKFGSEDASVLAFEYGLSVVRVYAIAKQELRRRRQARNRLYAATGTTGH